MNLNINQKRRYLDFGHVGGFVKFVCGCIDNEHEFSHQYTINNNGHRNNKWIRENGGNSEWKCISLQDAFRKYYWDAGFSANKKKLDSLSRTLQAAYSNYFSSSQGSNARRIAELDFLSAAWEVLQWGGVTPYNSAWMVEKVSNQGLVEAFKKSEKVLADYDYQNKKTWLKKSHWKETKSDFRMNAGFTKIYSLLYDDFLIYDSRVAAAIGRLAFLYCIEKRLDVVPDELRFPYMDAKEGPKIDASAKKNRNPSVGNLTFDKLSLNSDHAMWNLHANWILSEAIINSSIFDWKYGAGDKGVVNSDALRVLESALFMIGYDLG